ncbi:endoglucanase A [Aplysia californica]|uniref:cellulase n=1 Tax=Aplysia californica TaxID=6500 RepID=A0ABM1A0T0_APLCA|nr:endoglucanase A [Aplysia californica]
MTSLCLLSVLLLVGAPGLAAGAKNYGQALGLSIKFYMAQRSGPIHDSIVPWRGNSGMNDCTVGGWYDAGDNVKFTFPMATSAHLLMWSYYKYKDGYVKANQATQFLNMIKTPLNFFLAAWNGHDKLTGQVGDANADHAQWQPPEKMTTSRTCQYITKGTKGSDVAGATAASLALGYLIFKSSNAPYANSCLNKAKSLYSFGKSNRGIFYGTSPFYSSGSDEDDLCLGALWLYKATGDSHYLNDAKSFHNGMGPSWAQSWDDNKLACRILLLEATHDNKLKTEIQNDLKPWVEKHMTYTPCGLAWKLEWAPTRYAANTAFMALLAADASINSVNNRKFAVQQINYILGDNKHNGGCFSYQIGYGQKYPQRPHHRGSSCPKGSTCGWDFYHSSKANVNKLLGALVGGPDAHDGYQDNRDNVGQNEVATDYNAGFQGALAAIVHLQDKHLLPPTSTSCKCN